MNDTSGRAVAIVGLGAMLPDAPSVVAFWQNILGKRYSISETPTNRWSLADYYDPDPKAPDKTYSKIGGWVKGYEFDWKRFKMPPKVAAAMDQGQQWALIIAADALADYGYPNRPVDTDRTAVVLGTAMGGELHYITQNPDILRLFAPVKLWIDEHVERIGLVETVAVHSLFGFAGRIDLVAKLKSTGTWALIDFKTQKMKPDKKGVYQASYYETWPLQLMAYFKALNSGGECSRRLEDIASVVINSVEPTPVQVKVWPREEHEPCWQAFNNARELWCFIKGYRPQPAEPVLSA